MEQQIDFSSLTEQESAALYRVFLKQKEFEDLTYRRRRDLRIEILHLEERLSQCEKTTQDIHLCKICFKTKVADCLKLYCTLCSRKTCSRCGVRDIGQQDWSCLLCNKKKHLLSSTGDWFIGEDAKIINTQFFLDKLNDQAQEKAILYSVSLPQAEAEYLSLPVHRRSSVRDCDSIVLSGESDYYTSCFSPTPSDECVESIPALNVVVATDSGESSDDSDYGESHKLEMPRSKRHQNEMRTSQGRPIIERLTLTRSILSSATEGLPFGVHIVGGKTSGGGFMGAYIKQINPASKASKSLSKGDQIIEWNSISLVDATFEGTQNAISSSPKTVSIVVGHVKKKNTASPRPSSSQIINDAIEKTRANFAREAKSCVSQEELISLLETGNRSLEQFVKEQVLCIESGRQSRIQISLWHDPERQNLIIKILRAQSLSLSSLVGNEFPNPYAVVNLLPRKTLSTQFKTKVEHQNNHPTWNLTFIYSNITAEELLLKSLEVSVWSNRQTKVPYFIGGVFVELSQDVLCNVPRWYDIENHADILDKITIPTSRRFTISETSDVIHSILSTGQKNERTTKAMSRTSRNVRSCMVRSTSARADILKSNDFVYNKKRKTDSGGNTTRVCHPYINSFSAEELKQAHDCKTPKTRHLSEAGSILQGTLAVPHIHSAPATPCGNNDTRSMFLYSPQFINPSWNFNSSKDELASGNTGSSGSFCGSVRSEKTSKENALDYEEFEKKIKKGPSKPTTTTAAEYESSVSEISPRLKRKKKKSLFKIRDNESSKSQKKMSNSSFSFGDEPEINQTGPNQICSSAALGEVADLGYVRVGLVIENAEVLVVDIIRATLLTPFRSSQPGKTVDTYVKTFLLNEDRKTFKRKSSTVRHDSHPVYNCQVKYTARDISKKILNVCIWQNHGILGKNCPIGEVHISLDRLLLSRRIAAWYKLFPQTQKGNS